MESEPIVKIVAKRQIIDSKHTSKRKYSETDAYSHMRLNVISKNSKFSSITPILICKISYILNTEYMLPLSLEMLTLNVTKLFKQIIFKVKGLNILIVIYNEINISYNQFNERLIERRIQFLSLSKSSNACKQTLAAKALACFLLASQ
jgi:hypothetical protein